LAGHGSWVGRPISACWLAMDHGLADPSRHVGSPWIMGWPTRLGFVAGHASWVGRPVLAIWLAMEQCCYICNRWFISVHSGFCDHPHTTSLPPYPSLAVFHTFATCSSILEFIHIANPSHSVVITSWANLQSHMAKLPERVANLILSSPTLCHLLVIHIAICCHQSRDFSSSHVNHEAFFLCSRQRRSAFVPDNDICLHSPQCLPK
jgi:hypothetical protein